MPPPPPIWGVPRQSTRRWPAGTALEGPCGTLSNPDQCMGGSAPAGHPGSPLGTRGLPGTALGAPA